MEEKQSKKYWWLKLQNNFFEREEIKLIESMNDGDKYIIFYFKLLLKSVTSDGKLLFRNVIPYTEEMLAGITNTDIATVKYAINLFIKLGLMEKLDSGALYMLELENMVGVETDFARKKREYRDKLKIEDKKKTKKDNVFIEKKDTLKTRKDIVRQEIRDKSQELRQQSKESDMKNDDVDIVSKNWKDFTELEQNWALNQVNNTAKNKIAVALTLLRTGTSPPLLKKIHTGARKGLGAEEYEKIHGKGEVDPTIKSAKDLIDKFKIGGVS